MSSWSRPYGRISIRMKSLWKALADEAANGPEREIAEKVLARMCPYLRLMISGMMADLTREHHECVHGEDTDDPDPSRAGKHLHKFEYRCKILFEDGLIMSRDVTNTFTAEILDFLHSPQLLFSRKHAYMFALPAEDDKDALFEPLHRMR